MINYELAKKLKEAGFPMIKVIKGIANENGKSFCMWCGFPLLEIDGEFYLQPLLSELIEACDKSPFFELSKLKDGWGCNDHYQVGKGETPEEAVARLWLKLNKPR